MRPTPRPCHQVSYMPWSGCLYVEGWVFDVMGWVAIKGARIEGLLPGRGGSIRASCHGHRLFVDAVCIATELAYRAHR